MITRELTEFEKELEQINGFRVFYPKKLIKKHSEVLDHKDYIDDLILCEDFEKWALEIETKLNIKMFELDIGEDIPEDDRKKIMFEALKLENFENDDFMIKEWSKSFLNKNNEVDKCLKRFYCLMNDKFSNYLD